MSQLLIKYPTRLDFPKLSPAVLIVLQIDKALAWVQQKGSHGHCGAMPSCNIFGALKISEEISAAVFLASRFLITRRSDYD